MRRRAVLFHLQIIIIRKRDQNTYNKVTIVKKTNNETNLKFSDFSRDLFRFSYITSREIVVLCKIFFDRYTVVQITIVFVVLNNYQNKRIQLFKYTIYEFNFSNTK